MGGRDILWLSSRFQKDQITAKFLIGVMMVVMVMMVVVTAAAAAAAAAVAVYEKPFVTPFSNNLHRTQDESRHQTKQW